MVGDVLWKKPSGKIELLIRTHLPPFRTTWFYLVPLHTVKEHIIFRSTKLFHFFFLSLPLFSRFHSNHTLFHLHSIGFFVVKNGKNGDSFGRLWNNLYFCSDFDSPMRAWGSKFIGKRTFTNVIFGVQISQICNHLEENATATSTLGVLYPVCYFICKRLLQYHAAWAIELLILGEGNARAWTRDKRVEHPRLSFTLITNRWIGVTIGERSYNYGTRFEKG